MNGIDVYRLMFDDLCEECGIRPHKHNYLHFLEAVVMLKHKSSDIYISDLKSLFMKLVNHSDDTEETTPCNEEWEQLTLWDIIDY